MLYGHVGMLDAALRVLERAVEIDPTNEAARAEVANASSFSALYEDAIKANLALSRPVAWAYNYYLGAGRLDEARRMIDEAAGRNPGSVVMSRALLLAKEGRHTEARALLPPVAPDAALSRTFHHGTYARACVYALGGDAGTSVEWMKQTVKAGMPIYPAFARDTCFDPVRRSEPFTRFMAQLKPVWEEYVRKMQYTAPRAVTR